MSRHGRTHKPFYRINAVDQRSKRDGRFIENLGWFDPLAAEGKQYTFDEARMKHWLSTGAQPSETMKDILVKCGLYDADKRKAEIQMRIDAKAKAKGATAAAEPA
jgi:small subunit ribosomal protein S16